MSLVISLRRWIKSSFSGGNDGGNCVEVTMMPAQEIKTLGVTVPERIRLRDTDGSLVEYNQKEWEAFIKGVKAGEFDWDTLVTKLVAKSAEL